MPTSISDEKPKPQRSLRSDIVFSLCLLILLGLAWIARDVLLLIYVSALFAVVLSPAIEAVRRIHIGHYWPSRGAAIVLIVLVAFIGLGSFLVFAVPPMFKDIQTA